MASSKKFNYEGKSLYFLCLFVFSSSGITHMFVRLVLVYIWLKKKKKNPSQDHNGKERYQPKEH